MNLIGITLCTGIIQALKKSCTKGDKKKKKEVTEEIIRLELELEKGQNEELFHLKQVGFMASLYNACYGNLKP